MTCELCGSALAQPSRGRKRRYCSRSCQARAYRARRDEVTPPPRTVRPTRLTTIGILRAAVDLADRDGIDGLSMRRLASELGAATAALYRHFPDREALLGEMAELVLAEIRPPATELADWRARLEHEAREEWALYQRHPWMLPILARTRPPVGPALLDILERSFAALDERGLSREAMLAIYLSFSGLVQGLALLWSSERADRIRTPGPRDLPADFTEQIDPAIRPVLHRLFADGPPGPELDFDRLMQAGLALLLDGIAIRQPSNLWP
ncbi:TetR/AcrR family transcriptional regulator C-terminal domain-containing protein [Nocardia iowensis]|uniref:TetR/AcrR family transcriptional regulator C-terminal domain-containing protein n=1 Tax=Nocardia iowensis TaxID=204891 RepID=A0ABX8RWL7_NOCIO|nr:TetR/AcrR family transcriptional regulator C-terminal domain-containing protein [Nocardia iowensis]QXN93606.1 TetR/AcrR family transcriptional regulator C-terminal domain-containing protein [Nocardia iowensis]